MIYKTTSTVLAAVCILSVRATTVLEVQTEYNANCCGRIGDCMMTLDNTKYLGSAVKKMFQDAGNCNKEGSEESGLDTCSDGMCVRPLPTYPHAAVFINPNNHTLRSPEGSSDGVTVFGLLGQFPLSDFTPTLGLDHISYMFMPLTEQTSSLGGYVSGLSGTLKYDAEIVQPTPPTTCALGPLGLKTMYIKYNVPETQEVTFNGALLPFMDFIVPVLSQMYPYAALERISGNSLKGTMNVEVTSCD